MRNKILAVLVATFTVAVVIPTNKASADRYGDVLDDIGNIVNFR